MAIFRFWYDFWKILRDFRYEFREILVSPRTSSMKGTMAYNKLSAEE